MIFRFGNYYHRVGSAGVEFSQENVMDAKGEPYMIRHQWKINWRIVKTAAMSNADFDTALNNLEDAYANPQVTAALLRPNLSPTIHVLSGALLIGDIRVIQPPSYRRYQNGEYVTYRTGDVIIEAFTRRWVDGANPVISFTENVSIQNAGPVQVMLQPTTGPAIRQRGIQQKFCMVEQTGSAVYAAGFPAVSQLPPPLFSQGQVEPLKHSYRHPRRINDAYIEYPVDYSYRFEWPTTLDALPTRWS